MEIHNFSAGPSILPKQVLEQASKAVLNFNDTGLSLIEISHRTPSFVSIMEEARSLALELLGLNDKGYTALFLQGGASMEFVRVAYNLKIEGKKAGYVNTGTWSDKAIKEGKIITSLEEIASSKDKNYSYIPEVNQNTDHLSYLHLTSNNTIYGTQFKSFPKTNVPLVVDMSSDIFSRDIDYSQFDLIYAGAQKNIGAAGTNLIIIKENVLQDVTNKVPNILNYQQHILNKSMYNTPAVFAVYTCYLTLKWLKELGGVKKMHKLNSAKANMLYSEIDRNELFYGTAAKIDRSQMNAIFFLEDENLTTTFKLLCNEAGISGLDGHRSVGGYRASMYNAMKFDSVKTLVEVMQYFEKRM